MFIDMETGGPSVRRVSWTDLPDDEALLLWSLRRLVIAWPNCRAVEVALHRRWGDDAPGVAHLLRCWLHALATRSSRPLVVGDPACAMLLADEGAMLFAWANADRPDRAGPALAALCARDADTLLPLAAALGRFSASS